MYKVYTAILWYTMFNLSNLTVARLLLYLVYTKSILGMDFYTKYIPDMDLYTKDIPDMGFFTKDIPGMDLYTNYKLGMDLYTKDKPVMDFYKKYILGMDFYTKEIPSKYQVWISIPMIYLVNTRYRFLYQGYSWNIPGLYEGIYQVSLIS